MADVLLPEPDARAFAAAEPFPHLVVDLPSGSLDEAAAAFPEPEWEGWRTFTDPYQRSKRTCDDIARIPAPLVALTNQLSSPAFLAWLEELTGIEKLLPDPYLEGGGLHCSTEGGVLAPHTDFHVYPRLDLFRRLNVIVYLTEGWQPGDGGELELFRPGDRASTGAVEPVLGRMVVFRTDDRSVHGFPNPVGAGVVRRSLALYYYTASEAGTFSGDTNTYWRTHDEGNRARMSAYRALLFGSRSLSWLAHRAHPTLGRRTDGPG